MVKKFPSKIITGTSKRSTCNTSKVPSVRELVKPEPIVSVHPKNSTLINQKCRNVLKVLPDNNVQAIDTVGFRGFSPTEPKAPDTDIKSDVRVPTQCFSHKNAVTIDRPIAGDGFVLWLAQPMMLFCYCIALLMCVL